MRVAGQLHLTVRRTESPKCLSASVVHVCKYLCKQIHNVRLLEASLAPLS